MKRMKALYKLSVKLFAGILISVAPMMLSATACILAWGEPECPKELR